MRHGYTLLEMATVLLLLGLAVSTLLPAARRWQDRAAVIGAREAVAGLLVRARSEARRHGGASFRVDAPAGRVWVEAAGELRTSLDLAGTRQVRVSTTGGEVRLRFDGLGIGRAASRTLVFERGAARSRLVVSAYGRVRRP